MSHPILFRGLGGSEALGSPLILSRPDEDFVDALLSELKGEQPIEAVRRTAASARDGAGKLRLFQPVHRVFQVVAMEVGCDAPGEPRLDPRKIDSAGLVVRRLSRIADQRRNRSETYPYAQGWISAGSHVRGWVSFDSEDSGNADPDVTRRPQPSAGPAEATARLRQLLQRGGEPELESTAPLFVAPPDACGRAGRTVLFGMIPTASVEAADAPRAPGQRFFDDADVQALIPAYLRSAAPPSLGDVAGRSFSFAEASVRERAETQGPRSGWYLKGFLTLLRQLVTQFRAFDDTPRARALLAQLNRVALPFNAEPKSRLAGDYLAHAARLLVLEPDPERAARVELPSSWPAFPADVARSLADQLGQMAEATFAEIAPRTTRFEDLTAYYEVRAFVRIKRDDGCPPQLVWSRPSEPFSIAPWYENGGAPPISVQMPDLTRASVKSLRPNVALKLPRRLFNFINENDPKDLLEGKGKEGSSLGIDWICGFNIPIITICAFIVLFIFLALLNIVFWWLPFIRICFPIPSLKKEGS